MGFSEEEKYRIAVQTDPENEDTWFNLGKYLHNLGSYDEAIHAYRRAIEINSNCDYGWNNLGISLYLLKRFNEAESAYRKAIEIDPTYDSAWNNLGILFRDLKRYVEANAAFRKVVEYNPGNVKGWINIGLLLEDLKNYDEAEEVFRKALEINPENDKNWNYLGFLLEDLKRYDEAEEVFRKSLEINPNNKDTQSHLEELEKLKMEYENRLSVRILKTLQQVRQNVPFQLTRLAQLVESQVDLTERKVIEILSNNPEIGEYLPLEQVFIKHEEITDATISNLSRPTDTLQICTQCGNSQSVLIRQCTECNEELASCQICKRGFAENETMVKCPHCDNPFHKNHLLEYIKIKGECPVCKEDLKIDQI